MIIHAVSSWTYLVTKGIEIVKQNIPKNPEIILVFNEIYLAKNMPRKLKTKFGQLIVSPNTKSGLYPGKY